MFVPSRSLLIQDLEGSNTNDDSQKPIGGVLVPQESETNSQL